MYEFGTVEVEVKSIDISTLHHAFSWLKIRLSSRFEGTLASTGRKTKNMVRGRERETLEHSICLTLFEMLS